MNRRRMAGLVLGCLLAGSTGHLVAEDAKPAPYEAAEFPDWTNDLRRAEIVAFGALPLTIFYAQFAIDCKRFADAGWDRRYAPWPLKSAGAVAMTVDESLGALAAGCLGAVAVAVLDFFLNRAQKAATLRRSAASGGVPFAVEVEAIPMDGPDADAAAVPEGDVAPDAATAPADGLDAATAP